MTTLAAERYDRELIYGLRAHVIVRETEALRRAERPSAWCQSSTPIPAMRSATSRSTPPRSAWPARQRSVKLLLMTALSRTTCGRASAGPGAAPAQQLSAIRIRWLPSCRRTKGGNRRLYPVWVHPFRRMRPVCRARVAENRPRANQATICTLIAQRLGENGSSTRSALPAHFLNRRDVLQVNMALRVTASKK